ncbi:unnamed protein product [Paramecium pentaurelia]|uniref:Transcription factor CBF/NF-Y/archaeal histone domain-containing protein n=1 Tax=Paramecium pentaurelia TaxID=43138 RepID=A0A8S1W2I3_9CILI|nr:unnamed protein product [Paramecium pentaurelia]
MEKDIIIDQIREQKKYLIEIILSYQFQFLILCFICILINYQWPIIKYIISTATILIQKEKNNQQKCKKIEMEQLPKATVQQFIKSSTNGDMKCSNEFVTQVMSMAREYIQLVSDQANTICLEQGKKTISGEFFYKAISKLKLDNQIPHLKEIEEEIKEEVNVKNQNRARFQDEEHLKQLEEQQKQLYEKAKLENSKNMIDDEEHGKSRKLNIQFEQDDEDQQ